MEEKERHKSKGESFQKSLFFMQCMEGVFSWCFVCVGFFNLLKFLSIISLMIWLTDILNWEAWVLHFPVTKKMKYAENVRHNWPSNKNKFALNE